MVVSANRLGPGGYGLNDLPLSLYLCQLGLNADVVARFHPRNVGFLRRLLDFVADTTGKRLFEIGEKYHFEA